MFYLRSSLQNWEDAYSYRLLIALGFPFLNAGTVHPIFNFLGEYILDSDSICWEPPLREQHRATDPTIICSMSVYRLFIGRTPPSNIASICQTIGSPTTFCLQRWLIFQVCPLQYTIFSSWIQYWFSSSGLAESAQVRSCLIPVTINNTQSYLTQDSAYFVHVWPSHSVVQNLKKGRQKLWDTLCF